MKESPRDLIGGVPETMLIPLYARAVETERDDAIIRDPAAVEMMRRIDYDFSRFEAAHMSNLGVAVRTEIFDEMAAAFIADHPDAVVVNVAAGLDTRFSRLDNGRILWYDLDLPESMALRRKFITPGERQHFIEGSVLDDAWVTQVEKRAHTLFIVEGLLMYFTEAQVRQLLTTFAEYFPGAVALIEVVGVSQAERTRSDAVEKTGVPFRWGIRDAREIAIWDARIEYVGDVSIYDRYPARWQAIPADWGRAADLPWAERLVALRNTVDRIVHLRFSDDR